MKPGMRHLIGADEEGKRAAAKNRRGTELMQEGLQTLAASSENWKSTAAKSQQASLQNKANYCNSVMSAKCQHR